ncbi:hypothetical protein UPYG_G00291800 [Umbra pygmaea]|uniref:Cadherin domain-containing protein n=1 Tax=Umbra pygmaea TaxID=75934 RepID=A0ABD0W4W6_UMBPY
MSLTKMALHPILCICLIISCVDSCFIPGSLQATVPNKLPVGHVISKINNCDATKFTSSDPHFTIQPDGTIVSVMITMVPANGRTFSVQFKEAYGQNRVMEIYLVQNSNKLVKNGLLKRSKRRWSPLPFNILENDVPPFPKDVELIASDSSAIRPVYYIISGPGVTEEPRGVFSVVKDTGMLQVNKAVDREKNPQFVFQARVFDIYTNQETDNPLPITVNVVDVNDNAPMFTGLLKFTVLEQSNAGTIVGTVKAADIDQKGIDHSKIRYSLLSWNNLFYINPESGVISTRTDLLDREAKDKYLVTVEIKDMNGALDGLSNSATSTIVLGDINDNPPTFTKTSYVVTVKENQDGELVLRIPVEDKDLVNTPNWNSEFVIIKGNENGNFRIERDPETNGGLIYQVKTLDYEKTEHLKLEVMARNQAELNGTKAQWLSIPVQVLVEDVDEGPEFTTPTVLFIVNENTPNHTLIGTYTAIDPETKSSAGINYYKISDPASWINVDERTGQLKVANRIDRESNFVKNAMYNITIKAVDSSLKTGTGTVIIQVKHVNDHAPDIPSKQLVLCERNGVEMGSVLVIAEDKDHSPYSAPFSFNLNEGHDGKWAVKPLNDTAAMLRQTKELPTGRYPVLLMVTDLQGFGKAQTVTVHICHCRNGACPAQQNSTSLGMWAILAMLLALSLLLLLCILFAFVCVTKNEKLEVEDVGDGGGMLLKSNIEAPGSAVDSNVIIVPASGLDWSVNRSMHDSRFAEANNSMVGEGIRTRQSLLQHYGGAQHNVFSGQYTVSNDGGQYVTQNMTVDSQGFMNFNNRRYLEEKLAYLGMVEEGRYADDIVHQYDFEGAESLAGSVGCCSDQSNQEDLDFLNTLGPKFKTLAQVCKKK